MVLKIKAGVRIVRCGHQLLFINRRLAPKDFSNAKAVLPAQAQQPDDGLELLFQLR